MNDLADQSNLLSVNAIGSIKDLSIQNMETARQLEGATRSLQGLGQKLKELAGQFKV